MRTGFSRGYFLGLMMRAHRTFLIIAMILGVSIALIFAMASSYAFGSTQEAMTPLHSVLPLTIGAANGAMVGSTQEIAERFASPKYHRLVTVLIVATAIFGAGLMMLGGTVGILRLGGEPELDLLFAFARSTIACVGVGLLSGSFFGSNYAWLLPVLTFAFMTNYGYDDFVMPYPWNILTAPNTVSSIVLALMLFVAGLLAFRFADFWKSRHGA